MAGSFIGVCLKRESDRERERLDGQTEECVVAVNAERSTPPLWTSVLLLSYIQMPRNKEAIIDA